MKYIALLICLATTACLGLDAPSDDEYPIGPVGVIHPDGDPAVAGGPPVDTDDIHCPAGGYVEFLDTGICYRTSTSTTCPANWVLYPNHNFGAGVQVCHCPTGRSEFGGCTAQTAIGGDVTNCPHDDAGNPRGWVQATTASGVAVRGVCGIDPGAFWPGPGAVPKGFKSRLTDPVRVYFSRRETSGNTNLVVLDANTGTATRLTRDNSCDYPVAPIIGRTESIWDACPTVSSVEPLVPPPGSGVSWLMLSWNGGQGDRLAPEPGDLAE